MIVKRAKVTSIFLPDLFVWGETDEMAWNRLEAFPICLFGGWISEVREIGEVRQREKERVVIKKWEEAKETDEGSVGVNR